MRIPQWAGQFTVSASEISVNRRDQNGYVTLTREWNDGDEIAISMELPAVKVISHPYVEANSRCVALQRGPLLYCMEEIDNRAWTESMVLAENSEINVVPGELFGLWFFWKPTPPQDLPYVLSPITYGITEERAK